MFCTNKTSVFIEFGVKEWDNRYTKKHILIQIYWSFTVYCRIKSEILQEVSSFYGLMVNHSSPFLLHLYLKIFEKQGLLGPIFAIMKLSKFFFQKINFFTLIWLWIERNWRILIKFIWKLHYSQPHTPKNSLFITF